jgi:hypothetical protein
MVVHREKEVRTWKHTAGLPRPLLQPRFDQRGDGGVEETKVGQRGFTTGAESKHFTDPTLVSYWIQGDL